MAGLLPTPPPTKVIATSGMMEAIKPIRRTAPSKLRRNAERLAAYNAKKRIDLIQKCAKSLAESQIQTRVEEMQRGLEKIRSSYKQTLERVTDRLKAKIAQLEKRIRDKDAQFTDLHIKTLAPLRRLKAAEEAAKEAKRTMWIKNRSVAALSKILKSCGFRLSHLSSAAKSINANKSYYLQTCTYVESKGRYPCDCGRRDSIKADSFIRQVIRLCEDEKHEEAEMLIFGDVLKKGSAKKNKPEEQDKQTKKHDCSKSAFCSEGYCTED